jgi:hypothetical protein
MVPTSLRALPSTNPNGRLIAKIYAKSMIKLNFLLTINDGGMAGRARQAAAARRPLAGSLISW